MRGPARSAARSGGSVGRGTRSQAPTARGSHGLLCRSGRRGFPRVRRQAIAWEIGPVQSDAGFPCAAPGSAAREPGVARRSKVDKVPPEPAAAARGTTSPSQVGEVPSGGRAAGAWHVVHHRRRQPESRAIDHQPDWTGGRAAASAVRHERRRSISAMIPWAMITVGGAGATLKPRKRATSENANGAMAGQSSTRDLGAVRGVSRSRSACTASRRFCATMSGA
jgi:hypothetical protein